MHYSKWLLTIFLLWPAVAGAQYDPLAAGMAVQPPLDFTLHDEGRNRDIPVRVYVPADEGPHPVILFSHGLGGGRDNSVYLGQQWAAHGYVAVFMQHIGSDDSLWKDKGKLSALMSAKRAINPENFILRLGDVKAVIDTLEQWNITRGHALYTLMDLQHIGMSGHSFGAVTTQGVSGQVYPSATEQPTDSRIDAALVMSPSKPRQGDATLAFSKVNIPWLLMTGTKDEARITDISVEDRLAVYPLLPPGGKYELVLDGAEHMAFSDTPPRGDAVRNPNHHRVIMAVSTAFFDAYLKDDRHAKDWLESGGIQSVLEPNDRWQYK